MRGQVIRTSEGSATAIVLTDIENTLERTTLRLRLGFFCFGFSFNRLWLVLDALGTTASTWGFCNAVGFLILEDNHFRGLIR
jgi:hypothetical protein